MASGVRNNNHRNKGIFNTAQDNVTIDAKELFGAHVSARTIIT